MDDLENTSLPLPSEVSGFSPANKNKTPEEPEELTPDGETPRDPEAEDDGEDAGADAPVDGQEVLPAKDETKSHVASIAMIHDKGRTHITMRIFNGLAWVEKRLVLAEKYTAAEIAALIANVETW